MTKRDAIDQMYDDLFGVRKAITAQETTPQPSTDVDQKDRLFEEAIAVIDEADRVSSSLLHKYVAGTRATAGLTIVKSA